MPIRTIPGTVLEAGAYESGAFGIIEPILNALRDALQLEQIARLLSYLNGSVEDQRDDIIPESRLFDYLCSIIHQIETKGDLSGEAVERCVEEAIVQFRAAPCCKNRLREGLRVMAMACAAARMRQESERLYRCVVKE